MAVVEGAGAAGVVVAGTVVAGASGGGCWVWWLQGM